MGAPSLNEVAQALRSSWNRETSYSPKEWSRKQPSSGQCAVTALVLQDLLGGDLIRARINGHEHYWIRLDGSDVDLTREQFGRIVSEEPLPPVSRQFVLSFPDTHRRYRALKKSVQVALRGPSLRRRLNRKDSHSSRRNS